MLNNLDNFYTQKDNVKKRINSQIDEVSVTAASTETKSLAWRGYTANIISANTSAEYRDYCLTSDLKLRLDPFDKDGSENQLGCTSFSEATGGMTVRSGNLMFDGLFALSLHELGLLKKDQIQDSSYNDGQPIFAPAGGYWQTGEAWKYVWTRDTSYAIHLAAGIVDPVTSKNSLNFKTSVVRGDNSPTEDTLEIIQDTGTGGSWPISTDRSSWAFGVVETAKYLSGTDRSDFIARAYKAMTNTIMRDRRVAYDQRDGLYRGEMSFLDWREQTYADYTADRVVHIGMSKTLSCNVDHYALIRAASDFAAELGLSAEASTYAMMANDLKIAINAEFWLPSVGLYSSVKVNDLDDPAVRKYDMLGEALAIITGVADAAKAQSIMQIYPHSVEGPPVIWPQRRDIPIYHNRAIWPFVTAYSLRAAKLAANDAVTSHNVRSLLNGAAMNQSSMENFEFSELSNAKAEGDFSGPVINSRYQLWSVAGYTSMVLDSIFGLESSQSGIRFQPFITKDLRNDLFAGSSQLTLANVNYKGKTIEVVVNLPAEDGATSGYYSASEVRLNGVVRHVSDWFADSDLATDNTIEVTLVDSGAAGATINVVTDNGDFKRFFEAKSPMLNSLSVNGSSITLNYANTDGNAFINVYRNGVQIASGVTPETSWVDDSVDVNATQCYALEAEFPDDGTGTVHGNVSYRSEPVCRWPAGSLKLAGADTGDFSLVSLDGASTANDHGGITHYNWWGDANEVLRSDIVLDKTGNYVFQIEYGNAANTVNTGITVAVKWILVEEIGTGTIVASGPVVMPHMHNWDTWGDSTMVHSRVPLTAGVNYRVTISNQDEKGMDLYNMSGLKGNETYIGAGGSTEVNKANVRYLKILQVD